jgi:hypothetical protein
MEDKRGTKRDRSPSAEGSPLPGDAKTLPPGSPSVASSRNASVKVPMLNPSLFIADTSRDEEITRKLFGGLNLDLIGPPGDGKIIILNDDDEAQEGTTVEIECMIAPTSVDDAPAEARIDNSDDQGPNREVDGSDLSGHIAGNH